MTQRKSEFDTAITHYREAPPTSEAAAQSAARGNTEFVFDHRTQQAVVPRGAARGDQRFGKRTMNRGTDVDAKRGKL